MEPYEREEYEKNKPGPIQEKPVMKIPKEFMEDAMTALSDFNEEQLEAVLAGGNHNIKAVAGCGKTRTLAGSICAHIMGGVSPEKIGVSSFTTAAAEEIASRAEALVKKGTGDDAPTNTFSRGTFHSLARQELIRGTHPKARWKILPEEQSRDLWSQAANFCAHGLGNGRVSGNHEDSEKSDDALVSTMQAADFLRNMGLKKHKVRQVLDAIWPLGLAVEHTDARIPVSNIEKKFREIKEARESLDYTDLLELWLELLTESHDQKTRWEQILIDEFQDTNPLQLKILRTAHQHGAQITTCGDVNQCIASFNGSDPFEQERFCEENGMKELQLKTNYRSTPQILELGNDVLQHCLSQPEDGPPDLMLVRPDAEDGPHPQLISTVSGSTVNTSIQTASRLFTELKAEGIENPKVAILYRDNNRGNDIEEAALKATGTPGFPAVERRDRRKSEQVRTIENELAKIMQFWAEPSGSKGKALLKAVLCSSWFPQTAEIKATTIINALRCDIPDPQKAWIAMQKRIPNRITAHMGILLESWELAWMQTQLEESDHLTCQAAAGGVRDFIRRWQKTEKQFAGEKYEELDTSSHENFLLQIEQFGKEPVSGLLRSRTLADRSEADRTEHEARFSGIVLSTFHLSKGKEYDGVVLHHLNPGVLPHYRALEDNGFNSVGQAGIRKLAHLAESEGFKDADPQMATAMLKLEADRFRKSHAKDILKGRELMIDPAEEERRLLYVGITRARRKLAIVAERAVSRTRSNEPEDPENIPVQKHPYIPIHAWLRIGGSPPTENSGGL